MKKWKPEHLILGLTALAIVFLLGYFLGKNERAVPLQTASAQILLETARPAAEQTSAAAVTTKSAETTTAASAAAETTASTVAETATSTAAETAAAETTGAAAPQPDGLLDLNTATQQELEALPGIGPALASRILAYRAANGGFRTIQDLMNVSGIGEKRFAAVESMITVR